MSSEISSHDETVNIPHDDLPDDISKGDLKESNLNKTKQSPKPIRVLTVIAYVLLVSLAAILLSLYYILVWKSPQYGASGERLQD